MSQRSQPHTTYLLSQHINSPLQSSSFFRLRLRQRFFHLSPVRWGCPFKCWLITTCVSCIWSRRVMNDVPFKKLALHLYWFYFHLRDFTCRYRSLSGCIQQALKNHVHTYTEAWTQCMFAMPREGLKNKNKTDTRLNTHTCMRPCYRFWAFAHDTHIG